MNQGRVFLGDIGREGEELGILVECEERWGNIIGKK